MRGRLQIAVLSLTVALAGCSQTPSKTETTVRSSLSRAAAVQMIAEEWLTDTLPAYFCQRALASMMQSLGDVLARVRDEAADDEQAAKMLDRLAALDAAADDVTNAVARTDAPQTKSSIDRLRSEIRATTAAVNEEAP
jgi:Sec-independent protein translocase protein TatA